MYVRFLLLGLFLFLAASCKVEFDESMPFSCEEDDDCGGDGFLCIKPAGGGSRYCCKNEGFDFQNDAKNCGYCGNRCVGDRVCISGACRFRN